MSKNNADFVHLHVHTEYSLKNGLIRLEELIDKAKAYHMKYLVKTDMNTIDGMIRFYELAEKHGISPIIGCELTAEAEGETLILLASSNEGYEQIVEWLNNGNLEKTDAANGIIALSGGRDGIIHSLLAKGKVDLAEEKALKYVRLFGKGNFYLEVQKQGYENDDMLIEQTVKLSEKTGIPLVATHDIHYLYPEDSTLFNMMKNNNQHPQQREGSYFPSTDEMNETFKHLPEALTNTVRIAQRCNFPLEKEKYRIPNFPLPKEWSEAGYLKYLCSEGFKYRFERKKLSDFDKQNLMDRMEYELDLIIRRGLASYFLIVWDIVQYAKNNKIPIGPGRGSSAGSLVVYLLGITDINPLLYDLSFERFLNPDRSDLPDIDLDICQRGRYKILHYVKEKYGENQVVHLGVLNTYGTRGAVREAGKYLKIPKEKINLIAKLLPSFSGIGGIDHSLKTLPEFKQIPVHQEPYKSLFHLAERMEGMPYSHSSHPSGILIGNENIEKLIPIKKRTNGNMMTPFNKEDVKTLGLLKIDLLGLRNLTIIYDTLQMIKENSGKEMEAKDIPVNDQITFQTIAKGDTLGCFQLESMGIRNLMRKIKPKSIEDLADLLALYRPGAWQEGIVETYLRRRKGEEKYNFLLPEIKSILKKTYGLILYQEQVMEIANKIAGYSMGEADSLRRTLAKKSTDVLIHHKEKFIQGAVNKGISEEKAKAVFDFLVKFTGYSFNKAHSVSYAHISYWTVYLETHYPKEYMAALLSSEGGYFNKRVYLREIHKMGIALLKPDINQSGFGFQAEKTGIRIGLNLIHGVGPNAVNFLLKSRQEEGIFTSIEDIAARMDKYRLKKSVLKNLIMSGACDSLSENRKQMLFLADSEQMNLFKYEATKKMSDFSKIEKRRLEKKLLGFSLDQTPSNKWLDYLNRYHIYPIKALEQLNKNLRMRISGTIIHSKRQPTEKGEYLLILILQDHSDMVEVILYPEIYNSYLYQLNPEGILVEGILHKEDTTAYVVAEKIKAFGG